MQSQTCQDVHFRLPKPIPKPLSDRIPRRTKVTIAAGFPCSDGLVVCADTQETIPGYSKTDTQKIAKFSSNEYNIVFTGSGDGVYIHTFIDEVKTALDNEKPQGAARVVETIKTSLRQSFATHIATWPPFLAHEKPEVELLIGVQFHGSTKLYYSMNTGFYEVTKPQCIGAGLALAKSLVAQYFKEPMPTSSGVLIAMYVLRQAKRWVDGCGGKSDIVVMSDLHLGFSNIPSDDVEEMESHFDKFLESLSPVLVSAADRKISEDDFEKVMTTFRLEMLGLRGKFMGSTEYFMRLGKVIGWDYNPPDPPKS